MTAAEMDALLVIELDKASAPWFNPTERAEFLNSAYQSVINQYADAFETNEVARRALQALIKDSAAQAGAEFMLGMIDDLKRILKLDGVFPVTCHGKTTQEKRRIRPIQNDDLDQQDPFAKGDNMNPNYEEVSEKLVINSQSAPTNVVARYLVEPDTIDPVGAGATVPLLFGEDNHRLVVFTARDRMLENIESRRYPQSKQETVNA